MATVICSPPHAAAVENNIQLNNVRFISPPQGICYALLKRYNSWADTTPEEKSLGSLGPEPVTELLLRWRAGDEHCLEELVPLVEGELRRIAHRYMRMEREGHTLQTTALVNEAYLKLVDQAQVDWQNRAQFLGVSARLMRHILVDHARGISRGKRGGGAHHLPLDEALVFSPSKSAELVALDDALTELAKFDTRRAQVIELRYFGGLSVEEAAEVLAVHPNTVIRDWSLAKAWLKRELSRSANAG
jgi:RNA polymerase sigma factor (TIGR02999 family)